MTSEARSSSAAAGSHSQHMLSQEINAATRSVHTTLNRLITARLPLALPPHAASPRLYAFGLLHFAHVYLTFESAWHDIAHPPTNTYNNPALSSLLEDPWIAVSTSQMPPASHNPADNNTKASPASAAAAAPSPQPDLTPELRHFLATLLPPGLPRSRRLRRDLAALLCLTPVEVDVLLATSYPGARISAFCAHIRGAIAQRPHVLVAYAWVMYMAIFSGGRWIRAQLAAAGPDFWATGTRGVEWERLQERGLGLFGFDGEADGEDIKSDFKARLEAAEGLLSAEQRQEVVEEAGRIFEWCGELVGELDEMLDTPVKGREDAEQRMAASAAAAHGEKVMRSTVLPPAEKGGEKRKAPSAVSPAVNWIRQGGSIAVATVVLGGVYYWAACCLSTALRDGWHEGWAGI